MLNPTNFIVFHMLYQSNVLLNVSARPNGTMAGIHPCASSNAKHFSGMLY